MHRAAALYHANACVCIGMHVCLVILYVTFAAATDAMRMTQSSASNDSNVQSLASLETGNLAHAPQENALHFFFVVAPFVRCE